ncbi:hypothetical protein [Psychroflexus sp. ALD_RP9]|uniref:hypothetical protein n=1 Tax=Psychroflexus sp. ALD_RP9 TaxID=2777186 RepID=UPI001A8DAAA6|nr:hypothetical protein [Psychroflexus sp. ALD_RP9]QSS96928.1 hypothetical protein IMZ30_10840 [Psychroflexus sp. ALD_RP9]
MRSKYLLSITLLLVTAFILGVIFLLKDKYIFEYKPTAKVEVLKQWTLPEVLKEVSGIYYLGDDKMACIQDEKGIIYIYNLKNSQIINQFNFEPEGDFEGITIIDSTAYVLRSDGTIFQIKNYDNSLSEVKTLKLFNEKGIDVEGLFALSKDELLLGVKFSNQIKASSQLVVYKYQISTQKLTEFIDISDNHEIFNSIPQSHPSRDFWLSEIAYADSKYYITEGKTPKLMILNQHQVPQHLIYLDEDVFPQPEGIAIADDGKIFIASEENNNQLQSISLIKISPLKTNL